MTTVLFSDGIIFNNRFAAPTANIACINYCIDSGWSGIMPMIIYLNKLSRIWATVTDLVGIFNNSSLMGRLIVICRCGL